MQRRSRCYLSALDWCNATLASGLTEIDVRLYATTEPVYQGFIHIVIVDFFRINGRRV